MFVTASIYSPGIAILELIAFGVMIFSFVDVIRRPEWAWKAAGQSKALWLVLTIVGLLLGLIGLIGLIISGIYLLAVRPKVVAVQNQGGSMGGDGFGPGPSSNDGSGSSYGPVPDAGYGGAGYGSGAGSSFGAVPGAGHGQSSGNDPSGAGWALPSSSPPPPGSPPAGWYPDPGGSGQPRYWNGQAWTEDGPH